MANGNIFETDAQQAKELDCRKCEMERAPIGKAPNWDDRALVQQLAAIRSMPSTVVMLDADESEQTPVVGDYVRWQNGFTWSEGVFAGFSQSSSRGGICWIRVERGTGCSPGLCTFGMESPGVTLRLVARPTPLPGVTVTADPLAPAGGVVFDGSNYAEGPHAFAAGDPAIWGTKCRLCGMTSGAQWHRLWRQLPSVATSAAPSRPDGFAQAAIDAAKAAMLSLVPKKAKP